MFNYIVPESFLHPASSSSFYQHPIIIIILYICKYFKHCHACTIDRVLNHACIHAQSSLNRRQWINAYHYLAHEINHRRKKRKNPL